MEDSADSESVFNWPYINRRLNRILDRTPVGIITGLSIFIFATKYVYYPSIEKIPSDKAVYFNMALPIIVLLFLAAVLLRILQRTSRIIIED